jgi:ribosomal subunit interface protein
MTEEKSKRYFCKGLKIDDKTQEYVEKKVSALEKLIEKITKTEVEIDLDKKGHYRVEVMIKTPYHLYRAEDTTESIEGSIDSVENQLRGQITSRKDKRRTLLKDGWRKIKESLVFDRNAK